MGNSNVLYTAKVKKKKKRFCMIQNEENINEEIKPYLNIQSPQARKHLMVPPEQKLCFYISI